jgi:hypothetical protein
MSKGFYIGGYIAGFVLSATLFIIAFVVTAASLSERPNDLPLMGLGLLAIAFFSCSFGLMFYLMFIYRMWAAIQDGQARTTPGKAAGFMLIPIFFLYWIFPVFQGFAQDYNRYLARHELNLPRLDEQLFLFYPISVLCTIVPVLGSLSGVVSVVLSFMIMSKTCDAVNALARASQSSMAGSGVAV